VRTEGRDPSSSVQFWAAVDTVWLGARPAAPIVVCGKCRNERATHRELPGGRREAVRVVPVAELNAGTVSQRKAAQPIAGRIPAKLSAFRQGATLGATSEDRTVSPQSYQYLTSTIRVPPFPPLIKFDTGRCWSRRFMVGEP
jgi:hypothetical protein